MAVEKVEKLIVGEIFLVEVSTRRRLYFDQ